MAWWCCAIIGVNNDNMVHHCVVPYCTNSSISQPDLSFQRFLLNNKSLLKVWVHKMGRKNLALNSNSRVCCEHFVNSTHWRFRIDEYPTLKLPKLPMQVKPARKRRSPKKQVLEPQSASLPLDEVVAGFDTLREGVDVGSNSDMTGTDIDKLQMQIADLKQQINPLQGQVILLKFSLESIADNDKKVVFYTSLPSFASLMVCFEFIWARCGSANSLERQQDRLRC